MALPGHSPSLVLTKDIPHRLAGMKVGISRGLETDRFVVRSGSQRQESTLRGVEEEVASTGTVEHCSVEAAAAGVRRVFHLALTSVFCYGVAAVGAIPETETGRIRGASFFDVAHMLPMGIPSAHASGLLQMPPVRLVNR